jgi:Large polyvalent protein-associated domain 7
MAGEEDLGATNGANEDASTLSVGANGKDRRASGKSARCEARAAAGETRERAPREPQVNSIEARRKARRTGPLAPSEQPQVEPEARAPAAPPSGVSDRTSADSDPWTVPESIRNRFVQDGHRFYFADGKEAFKDRGRRLTTSSENTQVVHSLVEIARSRGWTEVTVSGTERFRQEAWRQARMAGLEVRGYKPDEVEQQQLIRALGRNLQRPADEVDAVAADAPASAAPDTAPVAPAAGRDRERIAGKLIEHGRDSYRHDPNEEPSYFVRIRTADGPREIWGKDIERALSKSLTQPQVGDEVILQQTGRDAVTVKRLERSPEGELHPKEAAVFRNRWVIEKREFFEERARAADVVRDASIDPRTAVRERPQLAGTYLNLHAAELVARTLRDPEDQKRFVAEVRSALAASIERGDPLQPVRLKERVPLAARTHEREIVRD